MTGTSLRLACFAFALCGGAAQAAPQTLTVEEKMQFLQSAKILKARTTSDGITLSIRATLSDGKLTHDAHIQVIDERKAVYQTPQGTEMNFRDSYLFNLAAYRLAQLLGIDMVPVTVKRTYKGQSASFTWWIDDFLMTEKERYFNKVEVPHPDTWNPQILVVRVFDQLIYNTDRNLGNLVIDNGWNVWMIDHTRAFRLHKQIKSPENLTRCDRKLLESLRDLNRAKLDQELKPFLSSNEIEALLARRDRIVQFFEEKARSSPSVFYDYLPVQRNPIAAAR